MQKGDLVKLIDSIFENEENLLNIANEMSLTVEHLKENKNKVFLVTNIIPFYDNNIIWVNENNYCWYEKYLEKV